ncbi:MAG TPA: hypothetical protein VM266_10340 [Solirubrobacteraceae bacterium]|nr:hypothetical protein [Solirubrobacteraceae bacterium]
MSDDREDAISRASAFAASKPHTEPGVPWLQQVLTEDSMGRAVVPRREVVHRTEERATPPPGHRANLARPGSNPGYGRRASLARHATTVAPRSAARQQHRFEQGSDALIPGSATSATAFSA